MDIKFGQRYERSQGESPEEFMRALDDFLKGRLSGLPLELELVGGGAVAGLIDTMNPTSVTLERRDESLIGTFNCEKIAAFRLIEEALDRSDELRPSE